MTEWQWNDIQLGEDQGCKRLCGACEIENPWVLVKIVEPLWVGWPDHFQARAHTPAQRHQALHVIGMIVRQQNARQSAGWEALGEIRQAGVHQHALRGGFEQRTAGPATTRRIRACTRAGNAFATI